MSKFTSTLLSIKAEIGIKTWILTMIGLEARAAILVDIATPSRAGCNEA